LIDSLVHDNVVRDDSITKIISMHLKSVHEAIDIATKEMKSNPNQMEQRDEKTGFKINQKLIQVSLFALAVIGSSYYWLDNRTDFYEPLWLIGSAFCYITIGFTIILIHNKTRLGYLLAGVLSWITLAFWLFDNYYVIFESSLIATTNELMAVRNFIVIFLVALTVVASHNLFHKVIDYQYKGKPI